MFTISVRQNGKWKQVTVESSVLGEFDLGLLTPAECLELATDFRTAADMLWESKEPR